MRKIALPYVLPSLLLLVVVVWPLITGSQTLFLRDVFNTHLPLKWVQAEAFSEGRFPLIDTYRDGGQPLAGNPNAVPFYPDNLLYLVAPVLWALNAHFWMHLLLAPFAFYWLARRWGLKADAAWAGGVFYVGSGFLLSCLNLYNLIAGMALAPAWVAATLAVGERRRIDRYSALAAGIWALLLVAGDPMIAAIALLASLLALGVRLG